MPSSKYSFIIVGAARNCEKSLSKSIEILSMAFRSAKKLSWLVIESDSDDNTPGLLDVQSKTTPNFRYKSLGKLRSTLPKRTERIAYCRNEAIEILRKEGEYEDIDFVVVADFDGLNKELSKESLDSCFIHNNWDGCLANQAGPYYDVWALRHPLWAPNDCWEYYGFLRNHNVPMYQALPRAVYARLITIPPTAPWIEVHSGFGGLALYRKALYLNCRYIGLTSAGKELCEHVTFSQQFRDLGGRLFINPKLINAKTTEHTRRVVWFRRWLKSAIYHFVGISTDG